MMLPQFEQTALSNAFNFTVGSGGPLVGLPVGFFANSTVMATKMSLIQRPNDNPNTFLIMLAYVSGALSGPIASKSNYAVSWGNTQRDQSNITVHSVTVNYCSRRSAIRGRA